MAGTADPHRLKELEQLREELHEAGSRASAGSLQQYLQLVRVCVAVSSIARGQPALQVSIHPANCRSGNCGYETQRMWQSSAASC